MSGVKAVLAYRIHAAWINTIKYKRTFDKNVNQTMFQAGVGKV